jgi:hypothetical protein
MKELQEKHGSVPRSWGFWLRIKRAAFLLWCYRPWIKRAGPYIQDPAVKRSKVPSGHGEEELLVFAFEDWEYADCNRLAQAKPTVLPPDWNLTTEQYFEKHYESTKTNS